MVKEDLIVFKKQLLISACLNIGHIVIGCTVGWTAPVIPKLQDLKQSPLSGTVTLSQASWIGSSFIIGGLIGPFLSAYLSNIIGRKKCLLMGGCICMLGYCITSLAKTYAIILVGRAVTGFATGIIGVLHLVYIGEIASPGIRGIILTSTGVFHTFGSLFMYGTGPYLSYSGTGYLVMSIIVLYILGCFYIPESPLYHAMRGNEGEATKVLNELGRGKNVQKELKNLIADVNDARSSKWTWREIISVRSNRKSFYITVMTYILQECSGMLAVMFFTTTIFQIADSSIEPSMATIVIGATQFVTIFVAPFLVERIGRKTLLLISTGGCCIAMVSLGAYFYVDFLKLPWISYIRWLPLLSLELAYSSFSFGLGIIPNTLLGEMYRPNVRGIGTSISMTLGWVAGIISVTSFGYIAECIGSYVIFFIYALINLGGFVFVLLVIPETKGMSLREIEMVLSR